MAVEDVERVDDHGEKAGTGAESMVGGPLFQARQGDSGELPGTPQSFRSGRDAKPLLPVSLRISGPDHGATLEAATPSTSYLSISSFCFSVMGLTCSGLVAA